MFPNLTLEAVGLRTVFFHTASTDRAAYIVSAGNISGLRFALNLHNQINAAPLAVQFCPLDWLGSFVLNSLTTDGADWFMLAIPELIWEWKSSATIPTPILFYDIGAFLCNVRYHPSASPLTRPARTAWGRLDRDFYSCRSACNRSQRSRNCLAAGHNEIFCIGAAWVSSLCSLFSTSFECFDWSCRRSYKYAAALLCKTMGKGSAYSFCSFSSTKLR